MTYYHRSREAALEAATVYEGDWSPRASFVPYNGWVIVLQPLSRDVYRLPLAELLDRVELDLTGFERVTRKPEDYKAPPAIPRNAPVQARAPATPQAPRPKIEVMELPPGSIAPPWAKAAPATAVPAPPAAPPSPSPAPARAAPSAPLSDAQPLIKAPWEK